MGPFNQFAVLDKPWYLHALDNRQMSTMTSSWTSAVKLGVNINIIATLCKLEWE